MTIVTGVPHTIGAVLQGFLHAGTLNAFQNEITFVVFTEGTPKSWDCFGNFTVAQFFTNYLMTKTGGYRCQPSTITNFSRADLQIIHLGVVFVPNVVANGPIMQHHISESVMRIKSG